MEKTSLHFSITGEFVTRTAREWFFVEQKPYSVVEELLLSCMAGTDTPEAELKFMAQDVLLGRAEFRGNSGDDTFCFAHLDTPADINIFTEYSKLARKYASREKEFSDLTKKYLNVIDSLTLWASGETADALQEINDNDTKKLFIDILRRYGTIQERYYADETDSAVLFESGNSMLDSYLQQQRIEKKFGDNYGWLDPSGTFYPVEWGAHQEWAHNEAKKRGYISADAVHSGEAGDVLLERGWVLLHSPSLGVPVVTENPIRPFTKAQRDFLFSYFSDRSLHKEAERYLQE